MKKSRKNYSKGSKKKLNIRSKNITKPNNTNDRKRKNLKFIKRSKDAEEAQRKQKIVEDTYKQKVQRRQYFEADDESEIEDEVNPFDELLSSLAGSKSKKQKAIESDDEPSEDSASDGGEEMDDEDMGEEDLAGEDEIEEMGDEEVDDEEEQLEEGGSVEENEQDQSQDDQIEDDNEMDEEESDEEDNQQNHKANTNNDPFAIHLDHMLAQSHIDNLVKKPVECKASRINTKKLGTLAVEIPKSFNTIDTKKFKALLEEEEEFASEGTEPIFLKKTELEKFQIKPKICSNVHLNQVQCEMFSIINNYQDFCYTQRSLENSEDIRYTYCLHALNHTIKTRQRILHHNAKLTAAAVSQKNSTAIVPDAYRDQGLVRPRVLIIVPFRDSAYRIVNILSSLLFGTLTDISKNVLNYKRFQEEYTGDTIYFRKTNPKPEDYQKTFSGNTDDTFRIGISFTKKNMKLYTEFYSSDILIASPLGLRMIIGASGDSERDYDFLSSLEVLVLDQMEMFFAQNWDHLLHVFEHMHLQPQQTRNTDFSRVRPWCLNGFSKFYRQTLMFASHELPEFRSLFNKCLNYRGKIRQINPVSIGTIRNVFVQIPQVFHKVDVSSLDGLFDQRFNYFINEILPQFKGPSKAHCMIYIPSYFDYVRIRNYFKAENMNFVQICEYTKDAKIARARDMFFHSAAHFLLYSERAHFFKRTKVKGIRHIIMYAPPNYPHLYSELLNFMEDSNQNSRDGLEGSMSATVLYTKYDMLQVSHLLGTDNAGNMLKSGKTEHMYMTEK